MKTFNDIRLQTRNAFVDDEKAGMFPTVDLVLNYLHYQR